MMIPPLCLRGNLTKTRLTERSGDGEANHAALSRSYAKDSRGTCNDN